MAGDVLRIKTLGAFTIERNGQVVAGFASRKAEVLLVYLARNPRTHPREVLADLLWDDRPQRQAMANLRVVLSSLRKEVGKFVKITRHTAALNTNARVWLDVDQLEASVEQLSEAEQPDTAEMIGDALALYEGDFLDGVSFFDARELEAWIVTERESIRRKCGDALSWLGRWHLSRGDHEAAINAANRLLMLDPLSEIGHRQLMEALARSGHRSRALTTYESLVEVLWDELAVEPSDETRELSEAIRSDSLDTADDTSVVHEQASDKLPVVASPIVGRERELADLEELLDSTEVRLITIIGPGGIGKTAVALEVARRVAGKFDDGVVFVSLAPLSRVEAVVPAIAQALAFNFDSSNARDPEEQLLNHLEPRKTLIVLDNFEHLLGAISLLTDIVQTAPGVNLLITSRERLRMQVEHVYPLRGLVVSPWKSLNDARQDPIVQLFLHHAQRVRPTFELREQHLESLREIFRLVGGMPLGVMLAAGWVGVLSPVQVAAEIRRSLEVLHSNLYDVPERQRSIRATFDYSWERLTPAERTTFAHCSLFLGGFTLDAVREVVGTTPRALLRLADTSLLTRNEGGRFTIHELLRQFAATKLALDSDARAEVLERYIHYFLALVEEYDQAYRRSLQTEWLDRLGVEYDNIRAALEWAVEQDQVEIAGRICGALGMFWGIRGYVREGQRWLDAMLADRSRLSSYTLGKVFFSMGWLAFEQADYPAAKASFTSSYKLIKDLDDTALIAEVLSCLGHVTQQQGEYDRAEAFCEESLALYRRLNHRSGVALILNRLGRIAELREDYPKAIALLEESLELRQAIGDDRGAASSLNGLAEIARYQGQYRRAASLYEKSLAICSSIRDKRCIAGVQHNLGHIALHIQDIGRALTLFQESLMLYSELENVEGMALCLTGIGGVLARQGKLEKAARLLSKSTALIKDHRIVLGAADRMAYEQSVEVVRSQMDDAEFEEVWASGASLPLAAFVEEALD